MSVSLIKVGKSSHAIVDSDNLDFLNKFKWYLSSHGYAVRNPSKKHGTTKMAYMHRDVALGHYSTAEAAANAYDFAAIMLYGEYAGLNFMDEDLCSMSEEEKTQHSYEESGFQELVL